MIQMIFANISDLFRLHGLEKVGVFPEGYAERATASTIAYLERVAWLAEARHLPGARPDWPGTPVVTQR